MHASQDNKSSEAHIKKKIQDNFAEKYTYTAETWPL